MRVTRSARFMIPQLSSSIFRVSSTLATSRTLTGLSLHSALGNEGASSLACGSDAIEARDPLTTGTCSALAFFHSFVLPAFRRSEGVGILPRAMATRSSSGPCKHHRAKTPRANHTGAGI